MNTASEHAARSGRRNRIILAALAFLTIWGFGTTAWFWNDNHEMVRNLNAGRLIREQLLGEKLQLEKRILQLNGRIERDQEDIGGAESRIADLRKKVEQAVARAKGSEGAVRRNKDLLAEVAALRAEKERLEVIASTGASNERDLQDQLYKVTVERDALTAELEQHKAGAQMVNNAEVDALRGRKGRITVLARRTRQVRMAFDLPNNLAHQASFKIIAPDGRTYAGADPAISMTVDEVEPEPTASIDMMPLSARGERASRVHLKFDPTEKLKPGTYRIDVLVGGDYLNTVLLNLR